MLDSRTTVDSLENADTSGAFAKFGSGPTQRLSFGPPTTTWTPPGASTRRTCRSGWLPTLSRMRS